MVISSHIGRQLIAARLQELLADAERARLAGIARQGGTRRVIRPAQSGRLGPHARPAAPSARGV